MSGQIASTFLDVDKVREALDQVKFLIELNGKERAHLVELMEEIERGLHRFDHPHDPDPWDGPQPKDPSQVTADPDPSQPAPVTYGATKDRAMTGEQKKRLVERARSKGFSDADLDRAAQHYTGKARYSLITQGEYEHLMGRLANVPVPKGG